MSTSSLSTPEFALRDRMDDAQRYPECARLLADDLTNDYFNSTAIQQNDKIGAFYFDRARIQANIVFDYLHQAMEALKEEEDKA